MDGRGRRRKGVVWEQAVARWLRDQGITCHRTGVAGQHQGDLLLPEFTIRVECKNRQNLAQGISEGLAQLQASDDPGVVIVKRRGRTDPGEALAVMTLADWLRCQIQS